MTLQAKLIAVLLCLIIGFGGGYWLHGLQDKAALSREQKAQIDMANKRADDRIREEQQAKQDAEADLAGEQAQTKQLNSWLNEERAKNLSLQQDIAHVHFTPQSTPLPAHTAGQPAASCPRSAVSAPEFVQLYTRAAQGSAAGTEGGGADPGGVP